eukprot:COSAG06_NODE_1_length_58652_cov_31.600967_35_plen_173_part_00
MPSTEGHSGHCSDRDSSEFQGRPRVDYPLLLLAAAAARAMGRPPKRCFKVVQGFLAQLARAPARAGCQWLMDNGKTLSRADREAWRSHACTAGSTSASSATAAPSTTARSARAEATTGGSVVTKRPHVEPKRLEQSPGRHTGRRYGGDDRSPSKIAAASARATSSSAEGYRY